MSDETFDPTIISVELDGDRARCEIWGSLGQDSSATFRVVEGRFDWVGAPPLVEGEAKGHIVFREDDVLHFQENWGVTIIRLVIRAFIEGGPEAVETKLTEVLMQLRRIAAGTETGV